MPYFKKTFVKLKLCLHLKLNSFRDNDERHFIE